MLGEKPSYIAPSSPTLDLDEQEKDAAKQGAQGAKVQPRNERLKHNAGDVFQQSMVKAYLGEDIDLVRIKELDVADGPSANIDMAYGDLTKRADQPPHTSTGSVHALPGSEYPWSNLELRRAMSAGYHGYLPSFGPVQNTNKKLVELSKLIKSVPGNLVRPIALTWLLNTVSALDRNSFETNAEVNASSDLYQRLFTSWPINAIGLVIALILPFVGEHTKVGKKHVVNVSMLVTATLSILITTDSTTSPALLWTVRLLCVYMTIFYAKIQYESYNMSLFHILFGMIGVFIIDFLAVGVSQSSPSEYPGDERIRFVFASFAASAFLCTCYAFLREQSGGATPTMHQPGEQYILSQSQKDQGDQRDQRLEDGLGGLREGEMDLGLHVVGSDSSGSDLDA